MYRNCIKDMTQVSLTFMLRNTTFSGGGTLLFMRLCNTSSESPIRFFRDPPCHTVQSYLTVFTGRNFSGTRNLCMYLHKLSRIFSNKFHRQFLRARALHAWKYLVIAFLYPYKYCVNTVQRNDVTFIEFQRSQSHRSLSIPRTHLRNLSLRSSWLYISTAFYQLPSKPWPRPFPRSVLWPYQWLLCHVHQILFDYLVPEGRPKAPSCLSPRDDGVAERFVLTYSSRIYLDPRKLRDRTAPSRYFPFYDSSTYDAFKPAKRGVRRTPYRIISTPVLPKLHRRS